MVHKFCENHLTELYEAIKSGSIPEIVKIEHELSPIEECVACAYALKAKGEVKNVLDEYLASQGFTVAVPKKAGILANLWFWAMRVGISWVAALIIFGILGNFVPLPVKFVLTLGVFVVVFIVVDQILGD